MRLVKLGLCRFVIGVDRLRLSMQLVERCHPHGYLTHAQLIAQDKILLRRLRLAAQRLDLKLELVDLIVYAQEVLLRFFKLALGLLLAAAVAGYAGRLLEDLAAIGAFRGHDLSDLALADDGIPVSAEAGVHKQTVYILKAHGLAVYVILAVPAAVIPACEHELRAVAVEDMLGVVYNKRYLRKAQCAALFGAAENDILHFAAAQSLRALLAHDPQYRVGYI